jgi:ppGpp synthetase/RelA/SpoT-type nucleotidyltranferase
MNIIDRVNKNLELASLYDVKYRKSIGNICKKVERKLAKVLKIILAHNHIYVDETGKLLLEIVSRVKESKSIQEKTFRKEISYCLDQLDLNSPEEVKKFIYEKYDDLIGIRILTITNNDAIILLESIISNRAFFEKEGIFFLPTVADECVDIMQNGIHIIKIKCRFSAVDIEIPFELQIKGGFENFWGDLEHKHFYKNYFEYSTKNNNRQIMNSIGNSLNSLDKSISVIIEASKETIEHNRFIFFSKKLVEVYKGEILKFAKFDMNTEKVYHSIFDLFNNRVQLADLDRLGGMIIETGLEEHISNSSFSECYPFYHSIRDSDLDIVIFEYIYWSISKDLLKIKLDIDSYISDLIKLINSRLNLPSQFNIIENLHNMFKLRLYSTRSIGFDDFVPILFLFEGYRLIIEEIGHYFENTSIELLDFAASLGFDIDDEDGVIIIRDNLAKCSLYILFGCIFSINYNLSFLPDDISQECIKSSEIVLCRMFTSKESKKFLEDSRMKKHFSHCQKILKDGGLLK